MDLGFGVGFSRTSPTRDEPRGVMWSPRLRVGLPLPPSSWTTGFTQASTPASWGPIATLAPAAEQDRVPAAAEDKAPLQTQEEREEDHATSASSREAAEHDGAERSLAQGGAVGTIASRELVLAPVPRVFGGLPPAEGTYNHEVLPASAGVAVRHDISEGHAANVIPDQDVTTGQPRGEAADLRSEFLTSLAPGDPEAEPRGKGCLSDDAKATILAMGLPDLPASQGAEAEWLADELTSAADAGWPDASTAAATADGAADAMTTAAAAVPKSPTGSSILVAAAASCGEGASSDFAVSGTTGDIDALENRSAAVVAHVQAPAEDMTPASEPAAASSSALGTMATTARQTQQLAAIGQHTPEAAKTLTDSDTKERWSSPPELPEVAPSLKRCRPTSSPPKASVTDACQRRPTFRLRRKMPAEMASQGCEAAAADTQQQRSPQPEGHRPIATPARRSAAAARNSGARAVGARRSSCTAPQTAEKVRKQKPSAPSAGSDSVDDRGGHLLAGTGHTLRPALLGCRVVVIGDGWGGPSATGRGYEAVVTEADSKTFTVVPVSGDSAWRETHVLQECCVPLSSLSEAEQSFAHGSAAACMDSKRLYAKLEQRQQTPKSKSA
mmetsp:Transcript_61393/g.155061  ORF Transcript_61393/g.155061 Transcript_61393/m.155061 type:complete len:614 (-) Transcript_61393:96-1937(-)